MQAKLQADGQKKEGELKAENTATLQSKRVTVKQMAAMAQVSERLLYLTLKFNRSDASPELRAAVTAGKVTVNGALRQLGLVSKPSRLGQAKTLWSKMSTDEQREFHLWVESGN